MAKDLALASIFFPERLPNSNALCQVTCLGCLLEGKGHYIGLPNIGEYLEQPIDMDSSMFEQPLLLYGPPNIGKTTLALQQGWMWLNRTSPGANAFIFNPRYQRPADIGQVVKLVDSTKPILVIVDDIHYADVEVRDWVTAIDNLRDSHCIASILWISRDGTLAEKLSTQFPRCLPAIEYPLDRVISLFFGRLEQYEPWQRVIAAWEGQLDPRIAKALQKRINRPGPGPEDSTVRAFVNSVHREATDLVRNGIATVRERLEDEVYEAYLSLLPFGSLGYPVESTFLSRLVHNEITACSAMKREGLVVLKRKEKDVVVLTEHPFQIRQKLEMLHSHGVRTSAHETLKQWFLSRGTKWRADVDKLSISQAAILLYFLDFVRYEERGNKLRKLCRHAEWSGVREPLHRALTALKDLAEADSELSAELGLGEDLMTWQLKLMRLSYPHNENEFRESLMNARWSWEQMRDIAEKTVARKAGAKRLDTILYEIGYIDLLLDEYSQAAELFERSVCEGLACIGRGMVDFSTYGEDARQALSHI